MRRRRNSRTRNGSITSSRQVGNMVNTCAAAGPDCDKSMAADAGSKALLHSLAKCRSSTAEAVCCQPRPNPGESFSTLGGRGPFCASSAGHVGASKPHWTKCATAAWTATREAQAPGTASCCERIAASSGSRLWTAGNASAHDAQKAVGACSWALRSPKPPCLKASWAKQAACWGRWPLLSALSKEYKHC